jgi:hypothetical protein
MEDLLDIARRSFTEVPVQGRHSPARTKNLQTRFYIDRYLEHQEAFDFLADSKQTHGEGPKTLIRALLYYRDTVAQPLGGLSRGQKVPQDLKRWMLDFTPKSRSRTDRTKAVSIRLHIDKISEHREVYEFLQRQQRLHGDGNKTVIKALLHYRQQVVEPLQQKALF